MEFVIAITGSTPMGTDQVTSNFSDMQFDRYAIGAYEVEYR